MRTISGPENCPFSWAQSPVNMLQHETYLTLATLFVVLRMVYLSYPYIMTCARVSWRRRILNVRLKSLWEHPRLYMHRAIQLFTSLTEPWKRRNLHGAMNAKVKAAWASKSLASVSFGEAGTSTITSRGWVWLVDQHNLAFRYLLSLFLDREVFV